MNITFLDTHNKKHTFIHIPKNAGKSISSYILKHGIEPHNVCSKSHATIEELGLTGEDLGKTFAVVRNPYTRIVSLYRFLFECNIKKITKESNQYFDNAVGDLTWHSELLDHYNGKLSFKKFCSKLPMMPFAQEQCSFIPADRLLRYETLETDFEYYKKLLNSDEPLWKINSTGTDNNWIKYYDRSTSDIVYEVYKNDFIKLGYKKL